MSTTTDIKPYPQGTLLWPIEPFTATVGNRTIKAFPGQGFWVTNTQMSQQITGFVEIARSGKNMAHAMGYSFEMVKRYFTTGA